MRTTQDMGEKFDEALESYLLNPSHSRMSYPAEVIVNRSMTAKGNTVIYKHLPEQVFSTKCRGTDHAGWRDDIEIRGYWRMQTRRTLYLCSEPDFPVWGISVCGACSDSLIEDYDRGYALFRFIEDAARDAFRLRRLGDDTFYPRGVKSYEQDTLQYTCVWTGDFRSFMGIETVQDNGIQIWSANFHGSTLHSF